MKSSKPFKLACTPSMIQCTWNKSKLFLISKTFFKNKEYSDIDTIWRWNKLLYRYLESNQYLAQYNFISKFTNLPLILQKQVKEKDYFTVTTYDGSMMGQNLYLFECANSGLQNEFSSHVINL